MVLSTGTRLGAYELQGPLGAGGMGEVYKARDRQLNREVALKVLPELFALDRDRLARFKREAQVLASLNHPNIAAIYGFEESDGVQALVLELVEGPTLADRIAKGPVPLDEALPIARQIAEALEAAHEHAIIHRDLKPANIKVRPDGAVKVLDFGLAKALDPLPNASDASQSPTITSPAMTGMGVILGTAAYMSPEQAKGHAADKRSDVWSFGCVLYEMLTGKRAFEGEDVSDTLASALKGEPDWSALPPDIPAAIRTLLASCLTKDRRRRIGDVSAALFALEHHSALVSVSPPVQPAAPQRIPLWRRAVPAVAAAVVVGVAAGYGAWTLKPPSPRPVARFTFTLPEDEQFTNTGRQVVAISPDGTQLVYVANTRLYLRSLSDIDARPLPRTEIPEGVLNPVFSPDGESIVFFSSADNTLKRINVNGGAAVTICSATPLYGMSWGPDGILFGQGRQGILRVSPNGGKPEPLVTVGTNELAHGPQMLPGGRAVLFTLATGTDSDQWDKARVVVQSLTSGTRKTIIDAGSDGRYLATGHLVYELGGTVFAVAFDPARQEVTGRAVPIVEGVRRAILNTGTAHFSVSNTGSLVYIPGPAGLSRVGRTLMLVDRNGTNSRPLAVPPGGAYSHPRVSPDGKHLAVGTDDGKEAIVWIYELTGKGAMRRLTFGGHNRFPVWSSDGRRVVFQSDRDGDLAIFGQPAEGTGPAERLTKPDQDTSHVPESWSPDGKRLLFSVAKRSSFSLWILSVDDKRVARFDDVQSVEPIGSVFSPDGRWVVYASSDGTPSPNRGVYVQPFPATGAKYQAPKIVPLDRNFHPLWAPSGHELFYIPTGNTSASVDVTTQPSFSFGTPVRLRAAFQGRLSTDVRNYDILPDGRFVGLVAGTGQEASTAEIRIVLNWFEELKRLVPTR